MIKLKQLYDLGKDLNDFSKFPKYIHHQRLGYKDKESLKVEWLPEGRSWKLLLGVITIMGKEKWIISYDLIRWEGSVEQRLPNTPEDFYDGVGGILGDSPSECIRGMKKWLQDEGF